MTSLSKDEEQGMVVLSLDTGRFDSLNALSQLFILEDILQAYEVDNDRLENSVKVYEAFDLIVATGTGGLIAALIGPLDMTIREAMKAYRDIYSHVFPNPPMEPLTNEERGIRLKAALQRIIKSQIGEDGLIKNLRELSPQKKIAITAMSPENLSRPTCFRTYRARRGRFPDSTLLDVLRATLSHVDEFPAVRFGDPPETFCSSSAGFCNPLDSLYDELTTTFGSRSVSAIVSIGVGRPPHPVAYIGPQPFADAAADLARSCEGVHDRFQRLFANWRNLYSRFDVDHCDQSVAIPTHCRMYLGKSEVRSTLDTVAESLNSRSMAVSVRDIERRQFGVQDVLQQEITKIPESLSVLNAVNQLSYAHSTAYVPGLMCFDNTRKDILSQITSWMALRSDFLPILWLDGPLGAGKSAVAHSITRKAVEEKSLASSFFVTGRTFKEKTTHSSEHPPSIDNLVSTLIRDLSGISATFQESVGRRLSSNPRYLTASPVVQLEYLLLPFLQHLPPENGLVWIIGGFDELVRQERSGSNGKELLNFLIQHADQLVPFLRIFVTSRPFNTSPIHRASSHRCVLHIPIDLTSQTNIDDMKVIAHQELVQLSLSQPAFTRPSLDDQLVKKFCAGAGELPLWLRITRRFLEQSLTPRQDLEELLSDRPNHNLDHQQQVDDIYAHVIRQLLPLDTGANQKHLRHVVFVLLALQDPLSLKSLEELFTGESKLPIEAIRTVVQGLRPLFLGVEDDRPIQFLHFSLRDFFRSSQLFRDLVQDVPSPSALGHCLLLRCSLRIMAERRGLFSPGSDALPKGVVINTVFISPAVFYGAAYWMDHILLVDPILHGEDVSGLLFDFFSSDAKVWMHENSDSGKFRFLDQDYLDQLKRVHGPWYSLAENLMRNALQSGSLNYLVKALEESKRFEAAMQLCSDVVNRWRVEKDLEPNVGPSMLANSLGHLALLQLTLGMHGRAIESAQQTVAHSTSLAFSQRGTFMSLLAQCLSHGGRWKEAIQASVEAIKLKRKARLETSIDPGFEFDLAFTLLMFSQIARMPVNKRTRAVVRADKESRKILRGLASKDLSSAKALAFVTADLAGSYLNAGLTYKAANASQKAVHLISRLAQNDAGAYNLPWGLQLSLTASLHSYFNEHREAHTAANKALDVLDHVVASTYSEAQVFVEGLARVASIFLPQTDYLQIGRDILRRSIRIGEMTLDAATTDSLPERKRKAKIATSLKRAIEMAVIEAIQQDGRTLEGNNEDYFNTGFGSAREKGHRQKLVDSAVTRYGPKGGSEVREWTRQVEELRAYLEAEKIDERNDLAGSDSSASSSSSESGDESTGDAHEEDISEDSDAEENGRDRLSEESSDTEDEDEGISEKSSETDEDSDNANKSWSPSSSDTDEDESQHEDSSDWDSSIDSDGTLPEDMSEDDSSSEEERTETS
ncbi:hypothetical protein DL96DRAFT_1713236 [Flagelloscypha sp. PMI_526]|nr:hypothetical protein DL96DRAFT_1713236 [Flagelloscypha sp. PMI_526]